MANIESKLTTIKSASGGEDVRDAIIGALRDINNDVPADMSNPEDYTGNMASGSDYSDSFNPPKLIRSIYIQQPNTGGKSMNLVTATITENGTYPTADKDDGGGSYDPDEEIRYYKKVEVKVPQLANAVMDLEEEITQNGTYSAPADWGVDGIRTFTVNVNAATGDGPFQVEFYDKPQTDPTAKAIYTELVPKGGSAEFKGTKPTSSIGPLTGWNPTPINVTRDMKCYPQFGQVIIDPTEIMDDWDVICAKGGQGYPLGSHKILAFGATFSAAEVKTWNPEYTGSDLAFNTYMMMYKVGEGEGNSHSSWISTGINYTAAALTNIDPWVKDDSNVRKFMQVFFNHMADIFKNSIVPVTKYSLNDAGLAVPTQDAIWIPNSSEIGTYQTKGDGESQYDFTSNTSWSGAYVDAIAVLDGVSTKYVRDFLNNDRNYPMTFANTYNGSGGNMYACVLRDWFIWNVSAQYNKPAYYRRMYNLIQYARVDESSSGAYGNFNIGFCL